MMMVMTCKATTILMMRWLVPNACAAAGTHALSTPSSETRFNTPFEPTIAVFTATRQNQRANHNDETVEYQAGE